MKKFLGVVVSVVVFAILAGAAVAQMEHGSGHGMHGAMTKTGETGHEMNCPMAKAGHEMMKNHMGKAGHEMHGHTGQAD